MGTQTIDSTTSGARTIWAIDPAHTVAEFAVKHMVVATTKGRFKGVAGTIALDEQNLAGSSVDVSIEAATVDSGDERRDGHLKSPDFFDVETYPSISFKSTRVEGRGDRFQVHGDLTIRDVTKPVTLEVERLGGGKTPFGTEILAYEAKGKINRKDFGLNWNAALEAGGMLVGDDVKITIDVETVKQ